MMATLTTCTQQRVQELNPGVPDLDSRSDSKAVTESNGDGASVLVTPHRDYLIPSTSQQSQHLPIQETRRPRHGSEELVL